MSDDKKFNQDRLARARNKTVMLTPEMTNKMRQAMSKNLADTENTVKMEPVSSDWMTKPSNFDSGWTSVSEEKETKIDFSSEEFQSQINEVEDSWNAFTETVIEPVEIEPVTFIEPVPFAEPEKIIIPQVEQPIISEEKIVKPIINETKAKAHWEIETPVVGFLISYDENKNGEFYPLRVGRLNITSIAPDNGNYIVLEHPSVSEMHAVMKITSNARVQILDQLSEIGTKIIKAGSEKTLELSGDKADLAHGDIVIFGERQFIVCTIDFGV